MAQPMCRLRREDMEALARREEAKWKAAKEPAPEAKAPREAKKEEPAPERPGNVADLPEDAPSRDFTDMLADFAVDEVRAACQSMRRAQGFRPR